MKAEWAQVPGPSLLCLLLSPYPAEGPIPLAMAVPETAGQLPSVEACPASSGGRTDADMSLQSRLGMASISGIQHSCGFRDV